MALARAIYRDADIYLLDDPLSAVDAHVSEFIFNNTIIGALMEKTRLLVTHQDHLLHLCDSVIVVEDGKIAAFGSYNDVQHALPGNEHGNAGDGIFSFFQEARKIGPSIADVKNGLVKYDVPSDRHNNALVETKEGAGLVDKTSEATGKALMTMEEKGQGDIGFGSYKYYFSAGGWGLFSIVIAFTIGGQFFQIFAQFSLADW